MYTELVVLSGRYGEGHDGLSMGGTAGFPES